MIGSTGSKISVDQLLTIIRDRKQVISFRYNEGNRAVEYAISDRKGKHQRQGYVTVEAITDAAFEFLPYVIDKESRIVADLMQTAEDMARG